MTKVTYTHATAGELSLETSTLPESAISYLLQYGFSQSLQDSIAGRAKAVREELFKAYTALGELCKEQPGVTADPV